MGRYFRNLSVVVGSELVQSELAVRLLRPVESVEDRGAAEVDVVENDPPSLLHAGQQQAVHPLELPTLDLRTGFLHGADGLVQANGMEVGGAWELIVIGA